MMAQARSAPDGQGRSQGHHPSRSARYQNGAGCQGKLRHRRIAAVPSRSEKPRSPPQKSQWVEQLAFPPVSDLVPRILAVASRQRMSQEFRWRTRAGARAASETLRKRKRLQTPVSEAVAVTQTSKISCSGRTNAGRSWRELFENGGDRRRESAVGSVVAKGVN
jgi:hypothetical protein